MREPSVFELIDRKNRCEIIKCRRKRPELPTKEVETSEMKWRVLVEHKLFEQEYKESVKILKELQQITPRSVEKELQQIKPRSLEEYPKESKNARKRRVREEMRTSGMATLRELRGKKDKASEKKRLQAWCAVFPSPKAREELTKLLESSEAREARPRGNTNNELSILVKYIYQYIYIYM